VDGMVAKSLALLLVSLVLLFFFYAFIPWVLGRIWRKSFARSTSGKSIRFTFDDGPDPIGTPGVLDVLSKYGVRAAFFVVGKNVERHPDLLRRIIREGHEIGFHSYSHRFPWLSGPWSTYRDMQREEEVLREFSDGLETRLYRPPYGKFNLVSLFLSLLRKREIVYWTLDAKDYQCLDAREIQQRVTRELKPGSVILFHDGGHHKAEEGSTVTAEALDMILGSLQGKPEILE